MGTQSFLDASSGQETHRIIFSCWDAVDPATNKTVHTMWADGSKGANCSRFGGEGVGSHCMISYDLQEGKRYRVEVRFVGSNASGAFWEGSIECADNGHRTVIGQLFLPHLQGRKDGYGPMRTQAASFQEYFLSTNCSGQVESGIGLLGPWFQQDVAVLPVQAHPSFAPGCSFSDVTSCITGYGCGTPM